MAVLNREEAELNLLIGRLHEDVRQTISSVSSPATGPEDRRAMQARIQGDMAKLRARMRDLELLAEEQETAEEGDAVVALVTQHKRRYEELQKAFREANLEVQRRAARAALEERRVLLGSSDPLQRAQQLKSQADLAGSAANTTTSLQRTRQLMAEELEHTSATLAALDASEGTLKDARGEYAGQRARIRQSHGLLTKMHRASLLDRLTLYGGAALFALVVLYIVSKRAAHFVPAALVPSLPSFGASVAGVRNASGWAAANLARLGGGGGGGGGGGAKSGGGQPVKLGGRLGQAPEQAPSRAGWDEWADQASRAHWDAQSGAGAASDAAQPPRAADGEEDAGSGAAQEWPDPSDPAYQEPVMRYRREFEEAEKAATEAAAGGRGQPGGMGTAHPGYGAASVAGGMFVGSTVNGSGSQAPAAANASEAAAARRAPDAEPAGPAAAEEPAQVSPEAASANSTDVSPPVETHTADGAGLQLQKEEGKEEEGTAEEPGGQPAALDTELEEAFSEEGLAEEADAAGQPVSGEPEAAGVELPEAAADAAEADALPDVAAADASEAADDDVAEPADRAQLLDGMEDYMAAPVPHSTMAEPAAVQEQAPLHAAGSASEGETAGFKEAEPETIEGDAVEHVAADGEEGGAQAGKLLPEGEELLMPNPSAVAGEGSNGDAVAGEEADREAAAEVGSVAEGAELEASTVGVAEEAGSRYVGSDSDEAGGAIEGLAAEVSGHKDELLKEQTSTLEKAVAPAAAASNATVHDARIEL